LKRLQNWHLVLCGISHKNSTSDERGVIQIGNNEIAEAHALFASMPGVMESTILSTCNRIEFYFVRETDKDPFELIRSFCKQFKDVDISGVCEKFYIKKGKHVSGHLFKVAAGMDSMVLGENEILGQVKAAYSSACSVKAAGRIIHRMFHQAFRAGKQVRTDTEMGKGACSVSTAAVALTKTKFGDSARPDILFIGFNKMISLAASAFARGHHNKFIFANRTVSKIGEIAAKFDARYHSLEDLPELISDVDIVFTCTGSPEPIITREIIDAAIYLNRNRFENASRKLYIIDIAVPNDVERGIESSQSIEILRIEDVERYMENLQSRQELAIPQAQAIIDRLLGEFAYWYDHIKFEPVYNGLGRTFEEIRRQEMDRVIGLIPADVRGEVEKATGRLTSRLLHLKARTSKLTDKD
jgi:glutamyl-tRNA reductase